MTWTKEELETLKTNYEHIGAKELSKVLGKNFWGVAKRAERLGLHSGPRENYKDVIKVRAMSELESAYLAGLIDGEGTISMKGYRHHHHTSAIVYISLSSTDEKVTTWLMDKIGGHTSSYLDGNPNHRKVFQWHTERARHVLEILQRIGKYVVIKQPHVKLAIKACRIRLSRPRASKTTRREFLLMERIQGYQLKRSKI